MSHFPNASGAIAVSVIRSNDPPPGTPAEDRGDGCRSVAALYDRRRLPRIGRIPDLLRDPTVRTMDRTCGRRALFALTRDGAVPEGTEDFPARADSVAVEDLQPVPDRGRPQLVSVPLSAAIGIGSVPAMGVSAPLAYR